MDFKRQYFLYAVATLVCDNKPLVTNPTSCLNTPPTLFVLLILQRLPAEQSNFKIQESSYMQSGIPVFIYVWVTTLSSQLCLPREPRAPQTPSELWAPTEELLAISQTFSTWRKRKVFMSKKYFQAEDGGRRWGEASLLQTISPMANSLFCRWKKKRGASVVPML